MRSIPRFLISLPLVVLIIGLAVACTTTVPSLFITIEDPAGLAPTQLRITVRVAGQQTHDLTRPEVPGGPLSNPQTLRVFMPQEAVGQRVDVTVEALRDAGIVGRAESSTLLDDAEDTPVAMALVAAEPPACDATTCPTGCCEGNACVRGEVSACGAGGGACNACDTLSTDQCVDGTCRCGADGPCPAGYRCEGGACTPDGGGQSCTANEQCTAPPGQCFEAQGSCGEDGKCAYAPKSASASCDDGNSCTVGDHCDGEGACVSSPMVCDGPSGQCHAEVGACVNGACLYAPKPEAADCTDDNLCTESDHCDGSGSCVGTPVTCDEPPNFECWEPVGACHAATGDCVYTQKPVGTACGSNTQCKASSCNAQGACVSSDINNGQFCNPATCATCSNGVCGGGCPSGTHCCGAGDCRPNGTLCP
ncbi:MAG TPA: hypothetical protein VK013_12190 [Myxococcaceae bacterium]|nr:hypothetical protein [Myxococcaceae bacterium]